jgi:hypothetical protein
MANLYYANPSNKVQDLSRLVPGSVINLDDWELENDDDDDDDDAGRAAGGAGRAAGCDGGLGS